VLPLKAMRRTLTRGPGTTCRLIATVRFSWSTVGMGFTWAKAWPMLPRVAVMESAVISSSTRENT